MCKTSIKGQINYDRLAKILAVLKSKELGYEVTGRIVKATDGVKSNEKAF